MCHDILCERQVIGHLQVLKKVDLVVNTEFFVVSITDHIQSVDHLVFSDDIP